MKGESKRQACFRTVIAYIDSTGKEWLFEGRVDGTIIEHPTGSKGFGYDPIFTPNGYEQTFAELPLSIKNAIGHRGKAMQKFLDFLNKV
jgi:XTP/dITP diphosphohydrolase